MFTLDNPVPVAFAVDQAQRTITGLALPYGAVATKMGQKFSFSAGTVTWPSQLSRVKLLMGHDFSRAVGVARQLSEQADGLHITARVATGAAGDEALSLAAEGVWDGLSVGIGDGGKFRQDRATGVHHAVSAPLVEVSLTPLPAFTDARVTSVAASAVTAAAPWPQERRRVTMLAIAYDAPTTVSFRGDVWTESIRHGAFTGAPSYGQPVVAPDGQVVGSVAHLEDRPGGLVAHLDLASEWLDAYAGSYVADVELRVPLEGQWLDHKAHERTITRAALSKVRLLAKRPRGADDQEAGPAPA